MRSSTQSALRQGHELVNDLGDENGVGNVANGDGVDGHVGNPW